MIHAVSKAPVLPNNSRQLAASNWFAAALPSGRFVRWEVAAPQLSELTFGGLHEALTL